MTVFATPPLPPSAPPRVTVVVPLPKVTVLRPPVPVLTAFVPVSVVTLFLEIGPPFSKWSSGSPTIVDGTLTLPRTTVLSAPATDTLLLPVPKTTVFWLPASFTVLPPLPRYDIIERAADGDFVVAVAKKDGVVPCSAGDRDASCR